MKTLQFWSIVWKTIQMLYFIIAPKIPQRKKKSGDVSTKIDGHYIYNTFWRRKRIRTTII